MINSTRRVEITKDNDKKGLNLSTVFKVYDEDKHQYTLTLYMFRGRFCGARHIMFKSSQGAGSRDGNSTGTVRRNNGRHEHDESSR